MILTATSRIEGIAILRHHDLVTGEAIVGGNVLEERHRAPRRSARRPAPSRTTSSAHSRPRLPALNASRERTGTQPDTLLKGRTQRRAVNAGERAHGGAHPSKSGPTRRPYVTEQHPRATKQYAAWATAPSSPHFQRAASTRRVQCPRTPAHRAVLASSTTYSPTAPSPPRPPSATPPGMILTMTSGIEGRRILLYHDLVIGEAIVGAGRRATRFNRRHCDTRNRSGNAPSRTAPSRLPPGPSTTPTTTEFAPSSTAHQNAPGAPRLADRSPGRATATRTHRDGHLQTGAECGAPANPPVPAECNGPGNRPGRHRVTRPGRRAATQPERTAPENRRHATDGRANAPETVSFPRARTHGCRLRRKGIRQPKKLRQAGTKRACAAPTNSPCGTEKYASRCRQPDPARIRQPRSASSTTSNRRTDPPIGTPAIRARATPRTGRIRILVLPARNQPRAAPLAHLLDEQREAERHALAKNPRAGHVELGHR